MKLDTKIYRAFRRLVIHFCWDEARHYHETGKPPVLISALAYYGPQSPLLPARNRGHDTILTHTTLRSTHDDAS
jgi:hypothetical protein